ncbi:MAG: hypothetical protein BI182_12220 [Acetobacterium sp. MES1]|nr:MAG: hypothetical protein BI182_12220 [Acetobacterium sp. MES1]
MNRAQINILIRDSIIRYVIRYSTFPTREAIQLLAQRYNVPKQVVSGNISWIVRSNQLNIMRCKPNSYLY